MLGSKLLKDFFNYGLGQVLPKIIGFLLIPLYTAYLTPAEFGLFDLAITLSAFLLVAMRLSVPGAITRFYYDYRGDSQEKNYITSIFWFVIAIGLVTGMLSLAVGYFFIDTLIPGLPFYPFVVLVVASSFLNSGSEIQKKLLQVRQQSAYSSWLNTFTALITIVLSITFVVYFNLSAFGLVLATTLASLILFIQAQYYLRNDIRGHISPPLIRESLKFSLVFFPYHIYGHLAPMVTKSILSAYGTLTAVGVLAVATKFTQPLTIIINAFGAAFTPHYLSIRSANVESDLNKLTVLTKRIWFGCCFIFIVFFLFSDLFMVMLASKSYAGAIVIMKIIACGFLPQMFYVIFSNELFFRKENKILLLINITGISSGLLLSWLLVRAYNEIGAAIAVITPSFIGAIMMFFYTRKKIPFQVPWMLIIISLVLTFLICTIDVLVHWFIEGDTLQFLIKGSMAVFFIIICNMLDVEIFRDLRIFLEKLKKVTK